MSDTPENLRVLASEQATDRDVPAEQAQLRQWAATRPAGLPVPQLIAAATLWLYPRAPSLLADDVAAILAPADAPNRRPAQAWEMDCLYLVFQHYGYQWPDEEEPQYIRLPLHPVKAQA